MSSPSAQNSTGNPASVHRRRRLPLWPLLAAALAMLTGCNSLERSAHSLMADLFPMTPTQAARDLFNGYDADARRRAINLISASKFGGEPFYVDAYRLFLGDPKRLGPKGMPDEDPTVRAAATKALGEHGKVGDADLIAKRLGDDSMAVRWEAAKALQKIHDPSGQAAVPLMVVLLHDTDADVRQAAATALGQYATPAVFNALVGALDDQSFGVVDASNYSLLTLTGYDFGNDGTLWLIWSRKNPNRLFEHQQEYVWQPYVPPRRFWQKAEFWNQPKPVPPRPPAGLESTQQNTPGATPTS